MGAAPPAARLHLVIGASTKLFYCGLLTRRRASWVDGLAYTSGADGTMNGENVKYSVNHGNLDQSASNALRCQPGAHPATGGPAR